MLRRLRYEKGVFTSFRRNFFGHGLVDKLSDRVHRLKYNDLNLNFGKPKRTKLRENLQDLLIIIRAEEEGTLPKIDTKFNRGNKVKKIKIDKLIEQTLFHTLLQLYSGNNHHLQLRGMEIYFPTPVILTEKNQSRLNQLLLELDIKNPSDSLLRCFTSLVSLTDYEVSDFVGWIKSISATRVTSACEALTNLSNIPSCVLVDVILRTPMLKHEFQLQLDLWLEFLKTIILANIENTSKSKLCFQNLIFYCIHGNSESLYNLIFKTLQFLINPRSGCQNSILTPQYINDLLWDLARISAQHISNVSPFNAIVKSQELLISHFREKPYDKLTLKGYMAIALAIDSISPQKSLQLFKIAETKFTNPNQEDVAIYSMVNTYLSKTPEDLMENFNHSAISHSHKAMLWLLFIKRLQDFGLMNGGRSIKLLEEMLKHRENLLITKDIMVMIVYPIQTFDTFDAFIKVISKNDPILLKKFSNILIPKYMGMLYKNYEEGVEVIDYFGKATNENLKSPLEYARYLYQNCLKKSAKNIGIMLQGEAIHSPETVYPLYKRELGDQSPDIGCIGAVIQAALKQDINGNVILWGELFAPQVAVHLFKSNIIQNKEDSLNLEADSKLWQQYIKLLFRYGYLNESAEIIKWWEQIQFVPDSETLLLLLKSLPIEHAERHISHYGKVKRDSELIKPELKLHDSSHWPWPTHQQLKGSIEMDTRLNHNRS